MVMKYQKPLENLMTAHDRYASTKRRDNIVRDTGRIPRGTGINPTKYEGTWDHGPPPLQEPGSTGITAKFPGFSCYGNQPKAGKPVFLPNDGPAHRWPTGKDHVSRGHRQRDSEV